MITNFLKKLFGKAEKPVANEFSEEDYELDYEQNHKVSKMFLEKCTA